MSHRLLGSVKMPLTETHGQQSYVRFRASFCDYALTSHCSDIVRLLINVELARKLARFFAHVSLALQAKAG